MSYKPPFRRSSSADKDYRILHDAVIKGDLELVKYHRNNGCPWSYELATTAAAHGQVEIFKWLVTSGCPRDANRCIEVGPPAIKEWFRTR